MFYLWAARSEPRPRGTVGRLQVKAYAGASKTSTLRLVAHSLTERGLIREVDVYWLSVPLNLLVPSHLSIADESWHEALATYITYPASSERQCGRPDKRRWLPGVYLSIPCQSTILRLIILEFKVIRSPD